MRVKVDGKEYYVSMVWNPDDTFEHYAHIGDQKYKIDLVYTMTGEPPTERVDYTEIREIFGNAVKKIIDNLPCDRRP